MPATDPALALATQMLHGPTFAAFYVAGITFVDGHVPPALRATGQTIFNAATFGLGIIAGPLVFGTLLDHTGFFHMYAVAGAVCATAALLLAVVVRE